MIKQYKLRFYNFKLVILLTAISLFGVQLVASASPDLRNKQLLGVVMGLVLLVILSLMDYSWILNFQWIMYGFNLLMLIGVRLFGSEAGGASRWLDIGGFRFQPTELSKVIIILFFAKFFMDHEDDINTFRVLAESVLLLAVPLALIYAQPDMKNTITVTIIFCILLYFFILLFFLLFCLNIPAGTVSERIFPIFVNGFFLGESFHGSSRPACFLTACFQIKGSIRSIIVNDDFILLCIPFARSIHYGTGIFQHRNDIWKNERLSEHIFCSAE